MNPEGSLTLYVLCSAMYGSLIGIWCSPDLAPASALFARARVALCVFVALALVFKAIWWKEKRESLLFMDTVTGLDTVSLQLDGGSVWYDKSGAKHTALENLFLQSWQKDRVQEREDCVWGEKIKYGLPQQSQPSSPKCECSAAASCVCPWRACTQWYQEPDNLTSGGAGVGWELLPLNAPAETENGSGRDGVHKGNEFKEQERKAEKHTIHTDTCALVRPT